jgi:hypothetical protein
MKIIDTFIVCEITEGIVRTPKFFKVYEIVVQEEVEMVSPARTSFILDDRGVMSTISIRKFELLKNNMLELGL